MKKILLSAVLASTLGLALAPAAFAADGTITFTGEVIGSQCSVTIVNGTASGKDFTVAMPHVQASSLTAGKVSGTKNFSIVLGGSGESTCTNGKTAYLYWEANSPQIDPVTGGLKNAAAGGATNVQVVLFNKATNTEINLNQPEGPTNPVATIAGNTARLDYYAAYKGVGGNATAGLVNTSVIYTVAYN